MPFNVPSVPDAYDRSAARPDFTGLIFREGRFAQGAELNELQSMLRGRVQRVGNMVAADGDRVEGAEIVVNSGAGTVTLAAGRVYVKGDVRDIGAATLTGVPMTGSVVIGIRLTSVIVTEIEEPDLLGLHPGSLGEGEPGAAREKETLAWGREGDGGTGALYPVYYLLDGVVLDDGPPPDLTGVNRAIAGYDFGAHGHYVVSGCWVSALGLAAGSQVFAIAAGEANILGRKFRRSYDLRHAEAETPDLGTVEAEDHTYTGGASVVITPRNIPLSSVSFVTVEKENTATVTRGAVSGTADDLPHTSIRTIIEVKQGLTTYVSPTDYLRNGDRVDWGPGGAEPAGGSTYTVKYTYRDTVSSPAGYTWTPESITVFGGATGGEIIIGYLFKLPRVDLLCLNDSGAPVYVKGLPDRSRPRAPQTPDSLLRLAEISNTWRGKPTVANSNVRSMTFERQQYLAERLLDALILVTEGRIEQRRDEREPAAKRGTFTDAFIDDYYRDAGEPQTAAVWGGNLMLPIAETVTRMPQNAPVMLDWTGVTLIQQTKRSRCRKINPYQVRPALPGTLDILPATDYWNEFITQWASPTTGAFTGAESLGSRNELLPLLRQIPVTVTVGGFAANEIVTALTFDGVDVKPAGVQQCDVNGVKAMTFTIPANSAAGVKLIIATGSAGGTAWGYFVGQGTLTVATMRQVVRQNRTVTARSPGEGGSAYRDPLAQPFFPPEGRFIAGCDVKFCAKGSVGNAVYAELVELDASNLPTSNVLAQRRIDMSSVVLNAWSQIRFAAPVWCPADKGYAFVFKTDDLTHSMSVARMGDADSDTGERIAAQQGALGPLLQSSDGRVWTPVQTERMTIRVIAAQFAPATKTHSFGSIAVVDCSDVLVRSIVELPTEAASVRFEVVRASGEIIKLDGLNAAALDEYITESVTLRAVLTGTSKVSPVIEAGTTFVAGKIAAAGSYITRAFEMGTAARLVGTFKALIPAGGTVSVAIDAADDNWTTMPLIGTDPLNDGWVENTYEKTPYTAVQGRIRISFTGGPAARVTISDFTAVSI